MDAPESRRTVDVSVREDILFQQTSGAIRSLLEREVDQSYSLLSLFSKDRFMQADLGPQSAKRYL